MFKNWLVVALAGALTLSLVAIVAAQGSTANVEVRVWQSTSDAERLYISARPEGGNWGTLGTIPLDMDGLNSRGTFRYGDINLAVPLPAAPDEPLTVDDSEGCQALADAGRTYSYALTILSCEATFHPAGYESIAFWSLEGQVEAGGTVAAYQGDYSDGELEKWGLTISWPDPGPCDSGLGVRITTDIVYVSECVSRGFFTTASWGGPPDYSAKGMASFPNRTYLYRFQATLDWEWNAESVRWWYLVPTE